MNVLVRLVVVFVLFGGVVWAWQRARPVVPVVPVEPVRAVEVVEAIQAIAKPAPVMVAPETRGDPSTGLWTSRDGRTMKGSYLSSTDTVVTVRREDGQVFTIPLANLSASDVAWVGRQARPRTITQAQIDAVVARFPYTPALTGEVTNDLRQLHEKYRGMVKFIRPGTVEQNLKMIRSRMVDDVKTLSQIAGTRSGDWSGRRGSSQSAAAESAILSARSAIGWLEGALSEHLRGYDALMAGGGK